MIQKLTTLWWQTIPLSAARIARLFGVIYADGIYLVAFPRFAAFTPLLVLIAGLLIGWFGLGATNVFSESLMILIIGLLVASISTLHGGMLVLGYAITDFFFRDHSYIFSAGAIEVRIALLITYIAFAIMTVGIPALVKLFRMTTPLSFIKASDAKLIAEIAFGGTLNGALTYLYLQVLPLLIRPPFTWSGGTPTVDAAFQAQHFTVLLTAIAVLGGVVRVLIEAIASSYDIITIDMMMEPVEKSIEKGGFLDHIPSLLMLIFTSVFGTVLFAGLLTNWFYVGLVFAAFIIAGILRKSLARIIPIWPNTMEKIPPLFRIIGSLILVYIISSPIVNNSYGGSDFGLIIWTLIGSLALMAFFFPPVKEEKHTAKQPTYHEEYL